MSEEVAASSSRRQGLWWLLGLSGVLVLAYVLLVLAVGRAVPVGTRLGDVSLGRLDAAAAKAEVQAYAEAFAAREIEVKFDGTTAKFSAEELGVYVDSEATFDAVPIASWNPLDLISALVAGQEIDPVIVAGDDFAAALDVLVGPAELPAVDATIEFESGEPVVVPAKAGVAVDREVAKASILAAAVDSFAAPVVLELEAVEPTVSDAAAQTFIDEELDVLIGEPVSITVKDRPGISNVFDALSLRQSIRFRTKAGEIEPYLLAPLLASKSQQAFLDATQPVRNATWDVSSGVPVVVPAAAGFGVSDQALAAAVEQVWQLTGAARTAEVEFGALDPEVSTASIEALGVKELISTYTQNFPAAAYRSQNIGQAAAYINGTLLLPGDTYSMNDTIKERTEANGYTSGWIIGSGGVFRYEPGGGVSTATTAMFNAAWFAGMTFKEWRAHSIFISRYPAGREATVSWGSLDMRFRNNHPTAVFITTKMTRTSITVKFWGTKRWEEIGSESGPRTSFTNAGVVYNSDENCHSQVPVSGFTITVYRTFFNGGKEVRREPYTTRYRATPRVICSAGPAPSPTKTTKKPSPTKTTKSPTPSASETATPTETTTP